MRLFKLQIKNIANGQNCVDEVLKDNRITSDLEYAKDAFNHLKKGDVILIHKGNAAVALVKVINKITNPNDINGISFGVDYRIEILDFFKNAKQFSNYQFGINKIGFSNTFSSLIDTESSTYKFINNWYNSINKIAEMKNYIKLLQYKKQIILQGPPGTGKTRLAKQLAERLIEPTKLNPITEIDVFFKQFKETEIVLSKRKEINLLLNQFQLKFPIENIAKLTLDDYVLGTTEKDSFSYWLEYKLKESGLYSGYANKYLIRWSEEEQTYIKTGFIKNLDDEKAIEELSKVLERVVKEDFNTKLPIGKGLVLKVLNSYFPNKYFPINSEHSISNALKTLGIDDSKLNYIEKNIKLQEYYLQKVKETSSTVTNNEFMRFLFDKFGLKETVELNNNEVIYKGESNIIQFHPSYAYEDFVRGITVKSNEKGIEYSTENKVLAIIANNAIENPSANQVLIIDEINRANLSSVLGELIYGLEYRNEAVDSMYEINGDRKITLPPNLYIIGTMNTADRSVGQIDYAIRRRFAFADVLPKILSYEELNENQKENEPELFFATETFKKVAKLFVTNENLEVEILEKSEHLADEFLPKDLWLGHSYFIHEKDKFHLKLKYEIKPILREYVADGILIDSSTNKILKAIEDLV